MNFLKNLFGNKDTTNQIADFLKTDKNALAQFEKAYAAHSMSNNDNFFDINSRDAATMHDNLSAKTADYDDISRRIIDELAAKTETMCFDGKRFVETKPKALPDGNILVTNQEINSLPEPQRPMMTGNLMSIDITEPSSIAILDNLKQYLKTGNRQFYHRFRQGLDILDFDELMYAIIDTNPNSISHWFPEIAQTAVNSGFFKIPATTIAKMPMSVLQLTRKDYELLTPATFDILDKYCMEIFNLDVNKDYFIKTGTYSSKFDFRNAHVHGEKEVRELGEYLLFIHHQANMMAGPLCTPCIYGVSTTTEWVVREFIKDTENNPCIYKGMPLHTEYRVFVDFDTDEILGIAPYWESETMNKRFAENRDNHDTHDGVIYKMHEETLMSRYEANKSRVQAELARIIPNVNLHGQWSVDIMQNGNDFWIIDMALAENSAFYDYVPENLRRPTEENWIPDTNTIGKAISPSQEIKKG